MTVHRRIRPFNTRETYPEQNLDNDLCQAVVAGSTVYLRGQIGQDLDTSENVGVGDVEAQAEQAMKNIEMLLEEAGGGLEHIVKVTVYLIDPRYREPVYRVMGRWLKGVHPVSTGIVVSALARPGVAGGDRRDRGARVTFALLGRCARTGRLGMAISSSSPAVASRCANVRAGVGVASSQNVTDPRLGPRLLDELGGRRVGGRRAATIAAAAPHGAHRQLAVVDAQGRSAAWSGARALGVHGTRTGRGWAAAGNLLASESVLDALGAAFAGSAGESSSRRG